MKRTGHCKHLNISLSPFIYYIMSLTAYVTFVLILDNLNSPLTFQNQTDTGRPILQASED